MLDGVPASANVLHTTDSVEIVHNHHVDKHHAKAMALLQERNVDVVVAVADATGCAFLVIAAAAVADVSLQSLGTFADLPYDAVSDHRKGCCRNTCHCMHYHAAQDSSLLHDASFL